MYDASLNLQTPGNRNTQRNQNQQYNTVNSVKNAQLMNNLSAGIDEGEFVLVGANSLSARFTPPKPQPQFDFGKMGKRSATTVNTLVKKSEESKEDVVMESLFSPILSAVFPGMHLLEMLNHGREAFEKINEGVNKNITVQDTKNINPVDAINPSKAFLPVTPFYAPTKPEPLLWDRVRNERAAKEEDSKKKRSQRMKIGAM